MAKEAGKQRQALFYAIKHSNLLPFGSDAFGFWESAGLYRPEPLMSRAAEEVKYSSAERELLLQTLSVLEKKCEDVNRTAEELETLERSSNLSWVRWRLVKRNESIWTF